MTHEELSRLEKEAGWQMVGIPIAHFKALVIAAERERCAKVCDEITNSMYWLNDRNEISQDCADAIRKGEIKDGNAD